MFGFVRDLAGLVWADNRFVRRNAALRSRVRVLEAVNGQLVESVDRLRVRRAIDRDVRVRAETEVAELTKANLKLSGLLGDVRQPVPQVDPVIVAQRLDACHGAVEVWLEAYEDFLLAERTYKAAWNEAYRDADGAEHLRKVVAEIAAAELRAVRDDAEVVWRTAERRIRLAEQGLRVATQGATDTVETPDGGE